MADLLSGRLGSLVRFHRAIAIAFQLFLVILSNRLGFLLRFDGALPGWAEQAFVQTLPLLLFSRVVAFLPFRLDQGLWRYTSVYDLMMMLGGIGTSTIAFFLLVQTPLGPAVYPRSVFVIDAVLLTLMLGGARLSRRLWAEFGRTKQGKRVLVFGAGDAGELIVRDMKNNDWYGYQPIGFVDDDRSKVGRRIHGVPVLGTSQDLAQVIERYKPHEVLLAIPRAEPSGVRSIVRALEPFKIPIKTLPNLRDLIDGKVELGHIRSLEVEDLLTRVPVGLDPLPLQNLIRGRRVMVTGAGGSIGSELCRQIVALRPVSLVMFERYENSLHAIRLELEDLKRSCGLHAIVGDVADMACVNAVLQKYQPDIIFHAAAHKHVPLMEENPCEAIKNNVRGTRLLARAAEINGVDRFILISTDKAVNPTSGMGASKRLAELAVQVQAAGSGTSFSTVRFGNVLGSNGSVVPRFLEQIKKGGPVTITHQDMRRFFMLIPEAVQLVLHAAAQAHGGATYVLEMGEQVKVLDMARNLIRLSGLVPDEEIAIEFIGLRPGEKLYEELAGVDEDVGPSAVDKILRVTSRHPAEPGLFAGLETIEAEAAAGNVDAVMASLKALIPEYGLQETTEVAATGADAVKTTESHAPAMFAEDAVYQECPKCKAPRIARSRSRTWLERLRREISTERLFRCHACGWRGWLQPLVSVEAVPAGDATAPDLAALDAAAKVKSVEPRRPTFSPRDLV